MSDWWIQAKPGSSAVGPKSEAYLLDKIRKNSLPAQATVSRDGQSWVPATVGLRHLFEQFRIEKERESASLRQKQRETDEAAARERALRVAESQRIASIAAPETRSFVSTSRVAQDLPVVSASAASHAGLKRREVSGVALLFVTLAQLAGGFLVVMGLTMFLSVAVIIIDTVRVAAANSSEQVGGDSLGPSRYIPRASEGASASPVFALLGSAWLMGIMAAMIPVFPMAIGLWIIAWGQTAKEVGVLIRV